VGGHGVEYSVSLVPCIIAAVTTHRKAITSLCVAASVFTRSASHARTKRIYYLLDKKHAKTRI